MKRFGLLVLLAAIGVFLSGCQEEPQKAGRSKRSSAREQYEGQLKHIAELMAAKRAEKEAEMKAEADKKAAAEKKAAEPEAAAAKKKPEEKKPADNQGGRGQRDPSS